MIQLTGTGLLADDLYLLAHDDVSGRPFLQPRALGLGLAGGLVAELVLAGRVRVRPGVVVADRALPRDELGCSLVGLLLGERYRFEPGESINTAIKVIRAVLSMPDLGPLVAIDRASGAQPGEMQPSWAR